MKMGGTGGRGGSELCKSGWTKGELPHVLAWLDEEWGVKDRQSPHAQYR